LKIDECLVLAGGFGTRLGNITKNIPKPLVPINGKPFIFFVLDYLFLNRISKVVLSISYLQEQFIELIPDKYRGMDVCFSIEDKPLGTGGAIINSLSYFKNDYFYVVNADTFISDSLDKYNHSLNINNKWDVLCGLIHLNDTKRYGRVEFDGDKITKFKEKEISSPGFINVGYYLVNKKSFSDITLAPFSFEENILQSNDYIKNCTIMTGDFIDIGTTESLAQTGIILKDFKPNRAIFIDRDGTLNEDKHGYTYQINEFKLIPGVEEGLKIIQDKGYKIIIISNQAGVAKGRFSIAQMNKFNDHLVSILKESNIEINDICCCPHHPEGVVKKYSITCDCRKPSTKSIEDAAIKHAIDLRYSFMVGNSAIDIQTGLNANLKSVLISDILDNMSYVREGYDFFTSLLEFAISL
jgi:D-glycero-D-manno-heptose 1,7-bisphosphate phosphatase